ncbi:hypothetical protein [Ancylobacter sp.]|uniref:hypothetical protein n=1 Tax=Ancylobacter sp. TaxID=1872567 RepID=UPI003D0CFB79
MKSITVVEPFTGYPEGCRRDFVAGQPLTIPGDVPLDFAKLIVGKGHAREDKVTKETTRDA